MNSFKYEKNILSFLSSYLNFYSKQLLSLNEKYLWFLPEVKVVCKTSYETWIIHFFKASLFRCLEILAETEFKVKSKDIGDLHVNNEWSIEVTHLKIDIPSAVPCYSCTFHIVYSGSARGIGSKMARLKSLDYQIMKSRVTSSDILH